MKILYYSPHPLLNLSGKAGYGTHMREMIAAFRGLGHDVLPVINGGTEITENSEPGQTIVSSAKKLLKSIVPRFIWRSIKDYQLLRFDKKAGIILEKKVQEYQPDLIYERGYYMQTSGVNTAKKYKVRHYMEINAPYLEENKEFEEAPTLLTKIARKRERKQIAWPDKVLVVSSALKDYFTNKIKETDPNKIIVVPNCVNLDKIQVDPFKKSGIQKKYALENHIVIGFVGSIFPYHGVDILIDAFDTINKKNKQTKLLIVGDGLTAPQLKRYSQTLASSNNIIFTGNVNHSDVFSYIDTMDIAVLADTKWYCSPIKIFEYGALSKAIIAPDTKAIRDVMTNKEDGLLIESGAAFLVSALSNLIEDKALREKIAVNFNKKIINHYTWGKAAEYILGLH